MVILVGDKPSKHNLDPKIPFVGSKCYPRLLSWIEYLLDEGEEYMLLNRTCHDFQLWVYLANFKGTPIIALGNVASKAIRYPHFKLPHPSGLNRQINNVGYMADMLKSAKEYVNASR